MPVNAFDNPAFHTSSMVAGVNKTTFKPGLISSMKVFEEEGVSDTTVLVENLDGTLALVRNQERGAPAQQVSSDKRKARAFQLTHLKLEGKIRADEVQGKRAFGTENERETVEAVRDRKLKKLVQMIELTKENLRLGAIKGVVVDADGTTEIVDLFEAFGISPPADVDFNLDGADPQIRGKCTAIKRSMRNALGDLGTVGFKVVSLCGDAFFDALVNHKEIREIYRNQQTKGELLDSDLEEFNFGGVRFINYQGGSGVTIGSDDARFFPLGVPGLFVDPHGPADYMDAANTDGLPLYSISLPDPSGRNAFVGIEVQSNPLPLCTIPSVLIKGTRT